MEEDALRQQSRDTDSALNELVETLAFHCLTAELLLLLSVMQASICSLPF